MGGSSSPAAWPPPMLAPEQGHGVLRAAGASLRSPGTEGMQPRARRDFPSRARFWMVVREAALPRSPPSLSVFPPRQGCSQRRQLRGGRFPP